MATVNQAVPAIRNADPNATIIGPATCPNGTGINTTFLTNCFNYGTRYPGQKGLLDLVDAVSVHPYQSTNGNIYTNPAPPENVVSDTYTPLTTLMKSYHSNVALPIVSSEWGYSMTMPGITEQVQGDYLARMMLVNLSQPGVVGSNWFDLKNDGTDATNVEDNFGMVANDFTPKTAYNEMQLLATSLRGETFTTKLSDGHTSDWLLVFTAPSGQETLAAWTTRSGRAHECCRARLGDLQSDRHAFLREPLHSSRAEYAHAVGHGADWSVRVCLAETEMICVPKLSEI